MVWIYNNWQRSLVALPGGRGNVLTQCSTKITYNTCTKWVEEKCAVCSPPWGDSVIRHTLDFMFSRCVYQMWFFRRFPTLCFIKVYTCSYWKLRKVQFWFSDSSFRYPTVSLPNKKDQFKNCCVHTGPSSKLASLHQRGHRKSMGLMWATFELLCKGVCWASNTHFW